MRKLILSTAFLLFFCGTSHADISARARLDFVGTYASGKCEFFITFNEPYEAINSDCNLFKMDGEKVVRQSNQPISGYDLGYPRPVTPDAYYSWPTLLLYTKPNEEYCQDFGDQDGLVALGHYSDPALNIDWPGDKTCKSVPNPSPFSAYTNSWCTGMPTCVYTPMQLLKGGYSSYIGGSDPTCHKLVGF